MNPSPTGSEKASVNAEWPSSSPDGRTSAEAAEVGDISSSLTEDDLESGPPSELLVPSSSPPPLAPRSGEARSERRTRLDHILEFVSFVGKPMPLTALLDGVPARISGILAAEVVSIYLIEGDGEGLVLRGNVGFKAEAQGRIRLRVGEGLTGLAVAQKQPVSVVRAPRHDRFRRFQELDEDRFPIFLAVPILGAEHRSLGAVVLQRAEGAFVEADVHLVAALTGPISHAVRQAALIDDLRENKTHRKTGGGTRKVTLPGQPVVAGRAIGALHALRRPAKDRKAAAPAGKEEVKRVREAFTLAERLVSSIVTRARAELPNESVNVEGYSLIASDSRLRERALELLAQKKSATEALSTVAREVTRAATSIVGDPFLAQRSRDIEDFCDAVLMLASPDMRAEAPSKAVLIAENLTMFDLIVTAKAQPVGIALSEQASPRTLTLLRLLGVPSIVGVEGVFRWTSPGDVVLVDADHGFFVLNPSRAEVAALRAYKRAKDPRDLALLAADEPVE